jgi:hypothetical protein
MDGTEDHVERGKPNWRRQNLYVLTHLWNLDLKWCCWWWWWWWWWWWCGSGGGGNERIPRGTEDESAAAMYTQMKTGNESHHNLFEKEGGGRGGGEWECNGGVNLFQVHGTHACNDHNEAPRIINGC